MTYEEAIQELKTDKALYATENCYAGDGTPDGNLMLALDMAIEALEKQIPKKPNTKEFLDCDDEGRVYRPTFYICPECGEHIGCKYNSFCSNCGQAIDWSDTE